VLGVSNESLHELIRYQESVWNRDRGDFYELSQRIPETLEKLIALELHMSVFQKLDVLQDRGHAMRADVALKPRIFTPGDFLIKTSAKQCSSSSKRSLPRKAVGSGHFV
jgi:hypothetical protein